MRRQRCGACSRRGDPVVGACPWCTAPYCVRHAVWHGASGKFICAKCSRKPDAATEE